MTQPDASPCVLAVVAHPDDECWCAGTLAIQADAGIRVHLAVVCNGNMGGMPDKSPEDRARIREAEIRRAAGIIGCELHLLGIGDDEMMDRFTNGYPALETQFRDLVRMVDPHLLIVPHLGDYHHHHRAVAEVALNASSSAGNASVPGRYPPASRIPATLFMQPIPPEPFEPHIYADISGAFDRKLQALRCHESQHPFLQSHHRSDFLGLVSAASYLHGAACGVQYAEAFALCRRFNRPATIQALAGFFPPSG